MVALCGLPPSGAGRASSLREQAGREEGSSENILDAGYDFTQSNGTKVTQGRICTISATSATKKSLKVVTIQLKAAHTTCV